MAGAGGKASDRPRGRPWQAPAAFPLDVTTTLFGTLHRARARTSVVDSPRGHLPFKYVAHTIALHVPFRSQCLFSAFLRARPALCSRPRPRPVVVLKPFPSASPTRHTT